MSEFDRYGRPIIDPQKILESLDPNDASWYTRKTRSQSRQRTPRKEDQKRNNRQLRKRIRGPVSSNVETATDTNNEKESTPREENRAASPKESNSLETPPEKSPETRKRKRPRDEEVDADETHRLQFSTEDKLREEVKLLKEITLATNNYILFLLKERGSSGRSLEASAGFINPFSSMQLAQTNSRPQPQVVPRSGSKPAVDQDGEDQSSSSSSESEGEGPLFVDIEDVPISRYNSNTAPQPVLEITAKPLENPPNPEADTVVASNSPNAETQSTALHQTEVSGNSLAPTSVPSTAESNVSVTAGPNGKGAPTPQISTLPPVTKEPVAVNEPPREKADLPPTPTLAATPNSLENQQKKNAPVPSLNATPVISPALNKQVVVRRGLDVNLPTEKLPPLTTMVPIVPKPAGPCPCAKCRGLPSPQIPVVSENTALKTLCQCPQCLNPPNTNKVTQKASAEPQFRCSICAILLASETELVEHLKSHLDAQQLKCNICDKKLSSKQAFNRHQEIHRRDALFKCSVCPVEVSSKSELIDHSKIHAEENEHQCSVCQMRVESRTALITHLKTHVGEKVYSCSLCGIKVAMDRWDEHIRYHTRST